MPLLPHRPGKALMARRASNGRVSRATGLSVSESAERIERWRFRKMGTC
jgi:hypothetical protein